MTYQCKVAKIKNGRRDVFDVPRHRLDGLTRVGNHRNLRRQRPLSHSLRSNRNRRQLTFESFLGSFFILDFFSLDFRLFPLDARFSTFPSVSGLTFISGLEVISGFGHKSAFNSKTTVSSLERGVFVVFNFGFILDLLAIRSWRLMSGTAWCGHRAFCDALTATKRGFENGLRLDNKSRNETL